MGVDSESERLAVGLSRQIEKLSRFRDNNRISEDEFCINTVRHLLCAEREHWQLAISNLSEHARKTIALCTGDHTLDELLSGANAYFPGTPTESELMAKRRDLELRWADLVALIHESVH